MLKKSTYVVVARNAHDGKVRARYERETRDEARSCARFISRAHFVVARLSRRTIETCGNPTCEHQCKRTYNDLLERWIDGVKVYDYQAKYLAAQKEAKRVLRSEVVSQRRGRGS